MDNKRKISIKTKIIASNLIVVTVTILVLSVFVYQYFSKILLDNAIRDNQKSLEEITKQLDSIEYQMSYIADYIITDTTVAEYAHVDYSENLKEINDDIYNMKEVLTRFVVLNEYLSGIYLLRDDGISFTNNADFDQEYVNQYISMLLKGKEAEEWDNRRFTGIHELYANNADKKMKVITYIARYNNITYANERNYLFLDVSYDTIVNTINQGNNEFDSILLLNKENKVYYGRPNIEENVYRRLIESETSKMIEEDDNIYILNTDKNSNWKTIVTISKAKLFSTITPVQIAFIFAVLLSYAFIIGTTVPILSGIIRPIRRLSNGMRLVGKGDYKVKVQVRSRDEIEELAEGFNHMTTKIEKSIEESIQHEKTKRRLQLDLLMNQINPHFIYNTLNTVIYMAHAGKTEEVTDITHSLINVLQDSVKLGKKSISDFIYVELEIVKNYMKIQKYRYPEMFQFEVFCEERLHKQLIPKMVIQPLVENALFHGVCLSEHPCKIEVAIKSIEDSEGLNDKMEISITDDGIGMDEEALRNCFIKKEEAGSSNKTRGIGLSNIKERLQFIYGANHSIEVISKPNQGTKIRIKIPIA